MKRKELMMKEIKHLIQQLRNYPSNLFIFPVKYEDMKHNPPMKTEEGLIICDKDGVQLGYIKTGGSGEVIIS